MSARSSQASKTSVDHRKIRFRPHLFLVRGGPTGLRPLVFCFHVSLSPRVESYAAMILLAAKIRSRSGAKREPAMCRWCSRQRDATAPYARCCRGSAMRHSIAIVPALTAQVAGIAFWTTLGGDLLLWSGGAWLMAAPLTLACAAVVARRSPFAAFAMRRKTAVASMSSHLHRLSDLSSIRSPPGGLGRPAGADAGGL